MDKLEQHEHTGTDSRKVSFKNLKDKPLQIKKSAIPVDLSGAATTQVILHLETEAAQIIRAFILYFEASSADAGITLEVGKESDRNYFYTGTSGTSKSQWDVDELTLLKDDLDAGDTLTFYSPGGKTGTGEAILVIEYVTFKQ